MLFGHLARMDETADARRILTGVHHSNWSRPVGRPYTSWMATLKSDLSLHNLTFEDAIELAMDKSLWRLLVASAATHWHGACRIMMMMTISNPNSHLIHPLANNQSHLCIVLLKEMYCHFGHRCFEDAGPSQSRLTMIPCSWLSHYGSRSMAVCGPVAWNSLPAAVQDVWFISIQFLQPSQNWTFSH